MKPLHPIELLACAIATQEGWFGSPTNMPIVRNNPGDLRYAGQKGAVPPVKPNDIATFSTPALGTAALFRQLWLQAASGQTVRQIVAQWAPPFENNTGVYLADV